MQPPWEHTDLNISPTDFEILIKDWVEKTGKELKSIDVKHNQKIDAYDSTYQIDVVAKFEAFGADFIVLIECKKHKNAIARSYVQILHDKLRSIGAHKGMLFATTDFQSGAIKYAKEHGIALIKISEGKSSYVTRSLETTSEPPPWANIPEYIGWSIEEQDNGNIAFTAIDFREKIFLEVAYEKL